MNKTKNVSSTSKKYNSSKKSTNISNLNKIIHNLLKIRSEIKTPKLTRNKFGILIKKYSYRCYTIEIVRKKTITIINFYHNSKSICYHHTLSYKPNEKGFNYHTTMVDHHTKKRNRSPMFKLKFENFDKYVKTEIPDYAHISFNTIKKNFYVFKNPSTDDNNFPLAEFVDLLLGGKPICHNKYKNSKKIFVVISKDYKKFGYIKLDKKKKCNMFIIMMFEDALYVGYEITNHDLIKNINKELEKNKTFPC